MSLSFEDRLGLVQEILNFKTDFRILIKTQQQENVRVFISQSVCCGKERRRHIKNSILH